jgi:hypothetical protein
MVVILVTIFRRMGRWLPVGSMAIWTCGDFNGGRVGGIAEGELFGVLVEYNHGRTVAAAACSARLLEQTVFSQSTTYRTISRASAGAYGTSDMLR